MSTDMLAGRLIVSEKRLVMDRVPVPEPGYGQALVKVHAAGVCLSDVHLLDGTLSPPFLSSDVVTLGHEVAGTIEALGIGAVGFPLGQRVLLQAGQLEPDGRLFTRGVDYDGGWAEYTLARIDTLVPIPDSLPFEQAAIVPDAVATPWSAVTSSGQVRPGEAVGVWGLGGLGTHAVQLLRLVGAAPIIALDPVEAARTRALDLGADLALDPSSSEVADQVRHTTQGLGIDVAFDFAGAAPVRDQALALLAPRGRLVLVGLCGTPVTIPEDTWFSFQRQTVAGAYGSEPRHVLELVRLAERGRLDLSASVSATLPLVEAPQAVEQLEKKASSPVRIVLRP
jgi:D-arabinose 1-dehydrogenase-like Zn-dependent alcohol dehydrogenase